MRCAFTMLETLREFGLEKLRRTGELAPLQRRMADYYTGLAEHAILFLQGAESTAYHRLILADYANIRCLGVVQAQREVVPCAAPVFGALCLYQQQRP